METTISVSKLPVSVKNFLFKNVTDRGISKFILKHDGEKHEVTVGFTSNGCDVTIQTDDECWTDETETWLVTPEQVKIGPGIAMLEMNQVITFLVRHQ